MATVTTARDQVTPALHKGRETITDTVLPAVRDTFTLAKEKGSVLLDSDAAHEAKRRSVAVLRAAKGDRMVVAPARRRWRFGLGMLAIGGGVGYGVAWLLKRLSAPIDSYDHTTPHSNVTTTGGTVGTGTGTGTGTGIGTATRTGTGTATTANDQVDLRAGAPTAT